MKMRTWVGIALVALLGLGLAVEAVDQAPVLGKIESGKPRYFARDGKAWQAKGRVVGFVKKGPTFQVAVMAEGATEAQQAGVEKLKKGGYAYEAWLTPGAYSLTVTAPGYAPLELKGVTVKNGSDLRIDFEFTPAGK